MERYIAMELVIAHHHYRPGGVRKVIELAAPHLVRVVRPAIRKVILAGGEEPDASWRLLICRVLAPVPVEFFIEPAFGYFSEQKDRPATVQSQCKHALDRLLAGRAARDCMVWVHNPGLARNLLFVRELVRTCETRRIPLLAHHHDWWFDSRWQRWQELRRSGFRTLDAVARTVFCSTPNARHIAINRADAAILQKHCGPRAAWIPNIAERHPLPAPVRVRRARQWLRGQLGDGAPVWLMPCRLLRRKNIAEALLLTRWLRPEAWLITTGGVSSAGERPYAEKLSAVARDHGWRLRLGILQGDESHKPTVAELLSASETALLTSIQEGFGLPYLETAVAHRPLIARHLPNIAPDLAQFGLRFPQSYEELLVSPALFDWQAEVVRQEHLFRRWLGQMPRVCRRLAGKSALLAASRVRQPVPFSRLTLFAQLEVLVHPPEQSWALCAPLNPFLHTWRTRAARRALRVTSWPGGATQGLSGNACARRFGRLLAAASGSKAAPLASCSIQQQLMVEKLSAPHLYPLLWSGEI